MGSNIEMLKSVKSNTLVSSLKRVDFAGTKQILPLPNGLVFVVDTRDNIEITEGLGHEPELFNKMLEFSNRSRVYVEVGANYGDFALQMSRQLGNDSRIYAFEPGKEVFESLAMSVFLNGASNVIAENLAILDKETEVSFVETIGGSLASTITDNNNQSGQNIRAVSLDGYFNNKGFQIDILRVDVEGSECKVLKGASNIIDSSPDIKIFIEWQYPLLRKYETVESMTECLSSLTNRGFIFIDVLKLNDKCDYRYYQLSEQEILMANPLDFLAVRKDTFERIKDKNVYDTSEECRTNANELLFYAASTGLVDRVKFAISLGANIEYIKDRHKPLSISSQNGHTEIVDILLKAGAIIEPESILYMPAQEGYLEVVRLLLAAGANPNVKAINDLTPLYIAAQNNKFNIVKLLLEHGANTEIPFSVGYTPLHVAASRGHLESIALLLKFGADIKAHANGIDAISLAQYYGHQDVVQLVGIGIEEFCQQVLGAGTETIFVSICEG